jgi:hypothetical protein
LAFRRGAFREPGSGWLLGDGLRFRRFMKLVFFLLWAAVAPEHPDSGFKEQSSAA